MIVPNRTGRRRRRAAAHETLLTVPLLVALLLSACYAPLADSGEGTIAMTITLPGAIFAQETVDPEPFSTQNFVARIYVGNMAYEDLIRRFVAYDDFLQENYYDLFDRLEDEGFVAELSEVVDLGVVQTALLPYYQQVETIMDDLEERVILNAATKFGGYPYYDVALTVADGQVTGSFTISGVPAGREYVVIIDVFEAGDQNDDDAEPVAYGEVWERKYHEEEYESPDEILFPGLNGETAETVFEDENGYVNLLLSTEESEPVSALRQDAAATLQRVLSDYRDREAHPVRSVFVQEGKTASIQIEIKPEE